MKKKNEYKTKNRNTARSRNVYEGSSVLIRRRGQAHARAMPRRNGQHGEASCLVSADRRVDEVYYAPASLKSRFSWCVVLRRDKSAANATTLPHRSNRAFRAAW